jgi:hypothetical protein
MIGSILLVIGRTPIRFWLYYAVSGSSDRLIGVIGGFGGGLPLFTEMPRETVWKI